MRLALQCGYGDVNAFLSELEPEQFIEWIALDRIEPLFVTPRLLARLAIVTANPAYKLTEEKFLGIHRAPQSVSKIAGTLMGGLAMLGVKV